MEESPRAPEPPSLPDLGFPRPTLGMLLLVSALVPAGVASLLGAAGSIAILTGLASTAVAVACCLLAARRLRSSLSAPLLALISAMEQLRNTGHASRVQEHGAPLLQPMLRRFNLATSAMAVRDQKSHARLLSIEAAFDRVQAVLQSLREGVVVVDASGRIVLANKSARRLLKSEVQIEGQQLLPLLSKELERVLRKAFADIDGGRAAEIRLADVPADKCHYDIDCVQVQSNRPDQDFGRVVVIADVTHNHEVGRLKDELLSSISHELRTPLTNICSSSEILTGLTAADETEWREFVQMLNTESHHLKRLVDDVMTFSKLAATDAESAGDRTDIGELLHAATAKVREQARSAGVELACTAPTGAMALVDAQMLGDAIDRLIDNAIKFTPANGRILVGLTVHDDIVDITIDDSGPGVPVADRQRVFEHFSQIGDVMTGKPRGTGLGLSITQRILQSMDGTIWCEGSPLGGARFRAVLPHSQAAPVG